jgi:hypothetical protein
MKLFRKLHNTTFKVFSYVNNLLIKGRVELACLYCHQLGCLKIMIVSPANIAILIYDIL